MSTRLRTASPGSPRSRLGGRRVGQAEIRSGLQAGDVVVTAGQMKLRDGARVRVIDAGIPVDEEVS
jgi:membrane fusion protein (multidrug efflux system)